MAVTFAGLSLWKVRGRPRIGVLDESGVGSYVGVELVFWGSLLVCRVQYVRCVFLFVMYFVVRESEHLPLS